MTAPINPTGGAGDSAKFMDMDDAAFAASIGLEKTHPTAAPEVTPRDTDGQFIAKDTVLTDTTLAKDAAATDTPAAEAAVETETPAETEAPAAEEKPTETPKPPLTKFQMYDKDGEIEVPTDLVLKYKVDGKIIENDLVKTVHLAQQAAFNARQAQDLAERNQAGSQQLDEAMATLQQYEANIAKMFADENLYARARALHLQSNTPERIAEAATAEAQSLRNQQQQHQEQMQVAQFVSGTIEPALLELVKEYPTIDIDDLAGRIAMASKPFEVNGRVPLANLPRIAHFVNNDLAQWAETVHNKRSEASRTASTSLDKQRAQTQAKQRQVAKALAPVSATASSPQKPASITRASDVFNDPIFGGSQ